MTVSCSEAVLLALSQTSKEALSSMFTVESAIDCIFCDIRKAIRPLTEQSLRLETKLRKTR